MKRTLFGVVAFLCFSTAFAQIPVTDGASIAQDIASQVETMAQWASQLESMEEQYSQMQTDYQQMVTEYNSMTGSRGLGTIMDDPAVRDYLPEDWQGVYDEVKYGGLGSMSTKTRRIYDDNSVYDGCKHITNQQSRYICEAKAAKASQDRSITGEAYNDAIDRIKQINGLMKEINKTNDPKSIGELQARIQSEQAMLQNEQMKLQLYSMISQAEEKLQTQRQHEMVMKDAAKRELPSGEPMTFDGSGQ